MRFRIIYRYDHYHDRYPFPPPFNLISIFIFIAKKFKKIRRTTDEEKLYLKADKNTIERIKCYSIQVVNNINQKNSLIYEYSKATRKSNLQLLEDNLNIKLSAEREYTIKFLDKMAGRNISEELESYESILKRKQEDQ